MGGREKVGVDMRFLRMGIIFLEERDNEIGLEQVECYRQGVTKKCLKTIPVHYCLTFISALGTEAEQPTVKGPKRKPRLYKSQNREHARPRITAGCSRANRLHRT